MSNKKIEIDLDKIETFLGFIAAATNPFCEEIAATFKEEAATVTDNTGKLFDMGYMILDPERLKKHGADLRTLFLGLTAGVYLCAGSDKSEFLDAIIQKTTAHGGVKGVVEKALNNPKIVAELKAKGVFEEVEVKAYTAHKKEADHGLH